MNRPISTKVHGILDYVSVPTLLTLPRVLHWGKSVTNVLTGAAVGILGYSALTRYELGLYKVLPMRTHLMLDMGGGALLTAAPFLLVKRSERTPVTIGFLAGFGLFEVAASLLSQQDPPLVEQMKEQPLPQWMDELHIPGRQGVTAR